MATMCRSNVVVVIERFTDPNGNRFFAAVKVNRAMDACLLHQQTRTFIKLTNASHLFKHAKHVGIG